MKELSYICHDGSFVWFVYIYILRIQKPGYAQLGFCNVESVLQSLSVRLPFHFGQVNEVGFDSINYGQECDTISPGRTEVCHLDVGVPVK